MADSDNSTITSRADSPRAPRKMAHRKSPSPKTSPHAPTTAAASARQTTLEALSLPPDLERALVCAVMVACAVAALRQRADPLSELDRLMAKWKMPWEASADVREVADALDSLLSEAERHITPMLPRLVRGRTRRGLHALCSCCGIVGASMHEAVFKAARQVRRRLDDADGGVAYTSRLETLSLSEVIAELQREALVSTGSLHCSFRGLRDEFRALADRDLSVDEGNRTLFQLRVQAAQMYHECAAIRIPGFPMAIAAHQLTPGDIIQNDKVWELTWQTIRGQLSRRFPGRLSSMPRGGETRRVNDMVHITDFPPERWAERARDDATACELLEELIDGGMRAPALVPLPTPAPSRPPSQREAQILRQLQTRSAIGRDGLQKIPRHSRPTANRLVKALLGEDQANSQFRTTLRHMCDLQWIRNGTGEDIGPGYYLTETGLEIVVALS